MNESLGSWQPRDVGDVREECWSPPVTSWIQGGVVRVRQQLQARRGLLMLGFGV